MEGYITKFIFDNIHTNNNIVFSGEVLAYGENYPEFDDIEFTLIMYRTGLYIDINELFEYQKNVIVNTIIQRADREKSILNQ